MSLYGRFFAAMYDRLMAGTEEAGLGRRRTELLARAEGSVLEIGAGTGVNLAHYPSAVTELTLTEPEEPMFRRLEHKFAAAGRPGQVVRAPAEQLPFGDDTFDTAVSTLALCTVDDPQRALGEIRRVLKPGGRLLVLEHVRSEEAKLARWQDRLAPLWRRVGHGCNCNRRTPDLIRGAGFADVSLEQGVLPKSPPVVRPLVSGQAVAR